MAESVGALLSRARKKADSGEPEVAMALFQEILALEPGNHEANGYLCSEFLRRGNAPDAVRYGERAIEAKHDDMQLHYTLAKAYQQLLAQPDCEAHLNVIAAEQPYAFICLLFVARAQEQRGESWRALLTYTRAINTAQLRGFWHDRESTQPWLLSAVQHGVKFARERRIAFYREWLDALSARHGRDEMRRVAECLQMFLGVKRLEYADRRQKPSFLYFPGLPVAPVFPREALAFADWYESHAERIREEAERVLKERNEEITAFHYDLPEDRRNFTAGANWDAYFFFDNGERFDEHHKACPETSNALAQLPLCRVREHSPEVCFSLMRPGAHILPHRGVTNTRTVLHLGLDIPSGCALNLTEVQELQWEAGKCFAFDDTYEHEAWNRSDRTRVILLCDIWNPYLTAPEREAIADLIGIIGDFNRETAPIPL